MGDGKEGEMLSGEEMLEMSGEISSGKILLGGILSGGMLSGGG